MITSAWACGQNVSAHMSDVHQHELLQWAQEGRHHKAEHVFQVAEACEKNMQVEVSHARKVWKYKCNDEQCSTDMVTLGFLSDMFDASPRAGWLL